MSLRNREAQEDAATADHGHRFAGGDDGTARNRHREHHAVLGRQHRPLVDLLLDDEPLGLKAADLAPYHVDLGLECVEPLAGDHPALEQRLSALQLRPGRIDLRRERLEPGVDRLQPELELVVLDERDTLAGLDPIPLGHGQFDYGTAGPRPRRHPVASLDLTVDRFPLDDLMRREGQDFRRSGRRDEETQEYGPELHRNTSRGKGPREQD